MRLWHGAASDVGLIRSLNEDSYVAGDGLYAVCDGMGGARAGEVASWTACQTVASLAEGEIDPERVRLAVSRANEEIIAAAVADPGLWGMGTTLTLVVRTGEGPLLVGHVGDSRAYLLHAGELTQVTEDHSLVAELVRRGQLTPEQAATHPHRSVITRALGTESAVEPDLFELEVVPGDRLLVCSDGLSGMLAEESIQRLLAQADDPQSAAEDLVRAALEAGGEDNVTTVAVFVEDDEEAGGPGESRVFWASGSRAGAVPSPEGVELGPVSRLRTVPGADAPGSFFGRVGAWAGRHRRLLLVSGGLAVLLLLALIGFALFNTTVYWVGTSGGDVALFQGLPAVVLGRELYRVVEVTPTPYATLPEYLRLRVDTHDLTTKQDGQQFIRGLGQAP